MRLLFVVNVDWMFVSHRLPIAKAAVAAGHDVHLLTSVTGTTADDALRGITVHHISIDRGSTDVFGSLRLIWKFCRAFALIKPDVVHLVTIKPVLFGGVAARIAGIRKVVIAISGLGYVFIQRGWLASIRRFLVTCTYRVALKSRHVVVIVQNPEDGAFIGGLKALPPNKIELIPGSGVDLQHFSFSALPATGAPVALLPARIMIDKGVREFVEAARILASRRVKVRCCLVGAIETANPSGISAQVLGKWEAEGVVEYWGERKDMPTVLSEATVVVLPSYREGMPKVLLEAAACGRPTIASNVPGCRDAIAPGVTGILVPVRDAASLAESIAQMILDPEACARMGLEGRRLAEQRFDVREVVRRHMAIYEQPASDP